MKRASSFLKRYAGRRQFLGLSTTLPRFYGSERDTARHDALRELISLMPMSFFKS